MEGKDAAQLHELLVIFKQKDILEKVMVHTYITLHNQV
jgi:hypothetical protein